MLMFCFDIHSDAIRKVQIKDESWRKKHYLPAQITAIAIATTTTTITTTHNRIE